MALHHDIFVRSLDDTLADADLFGPEGVCPVRHEGGNPHVVLVSGANAGGKSFFGRYLGVGIRAHEDECRIEYLPVTMGMRTAPGLHRAFMFPGEEGRESTGRISVAAVLGGLRTCRGRSSPHWLLLDEPDVGLSESYQRALGETLRTFALDLPENTAGIVVVTHSRMLASEFTGADPTMIRVGDDLRPTREWIGQGDLPRSAADVEGLSDVALKRMRAIARIMEARRQAERADNPSP